MFIVDSLLLIALALACAYHQLKPLYWTVLYGLVLVLFASLGGLNPLLFILFGALYLLAAFFALAPQWRRPMVTLKAMKFLQKRMPSISTTESEAIKAGDAWWEKDLFSGAPDWSKLHAYPKPCLTADEESFLNNQVDTLCGLLDDWEIVRETHDLPEKAWRYLQKEKFFGLVIPKEYGGLGFSALAHSTIVAKVASRSLSAAINMMVPNSLGPGELLVHYGTPEQKDYYLPRLAKGEEVPCFALTGTDAGSDAGSITDSGVICEEKFEGKKTLGIRLTWDKRYITLAPVATVLGLAVHLYDPEHLLGEEEDIGITLCLIPTSHPGVEIGHRHFPMYLSFMNGPTRGEDVFIPLDWIIGGRGMAGRGWHMLMESLSIGRSISLPTLSTASAKWIYTVTGAYARIRKQFNLPIAYFEGVEKLLSSIAGGTYQLEAARRMTAGAVDQGIKPAIASAIAKYHMTEMSRRVLMHAMDVHGGHGVQAGPNNPLINAYLGNPISITVEGANVLTRNLIIFGQGSIRCHPYLLREVELLSSTGSAALDEFDRTLMSHLGFALRNFARTAWYGLTGGRFISSSAQKPLRYYYQQLTRMSSALAFWSDVTLLVLGGNLKRRESISARLGDVLSELYLASSVLKYFRDQGQPNDDLPYVNWCLKFCLYRSQVAFRELAENFPSKALGKLLLALVFPFGPAYSKPSDQLGHELMPAMLTPSALRTRLQEHIYLPKEPDAWLSVLEQAFNKIDDIDPIAKKFQNAKRHGKVAGWLGFEEQLAAALKDGLLTKAEAQALEEYEKLRLDIIKVSEFSPDLRKVIQ